MEEYLPEGEEYIPNLMLSPQEEPSGRCTALLLDLYRTYSPMSELSHISGQINSSGWAVPRPPSKQKKLPIPFGLL